MSWRFYRLVSWRFLHKHDRPRKFSAVVQGLKGPLQKKSDERRSVTVFSKVRGQAGEGNFDGVPGLKTPRWLRAPRSHQESIRILQKVIATGYFHRDGLFWRDSILARQVILARQIILARREPENIKKKHKMCVK